MKSSSSSFSSSYSFSKSNIDHEGWVKTMRKSILEPDDEQVSKTPVCIFTVPQVLLATHPESYIPQQVALGPFHHWRPEVYDMHRYKLDSARQTHKFNNKTFDCIVESMKKHEEQIRASYHKFLDMSGEVLVWIMTVDMTFLLEFLRVHSMKEQGQTLEMVTPSMSHLMDASGKKLSHMAILRDLVMVENQIPLFLMKTMVEHQIRDGKSKSAASQTLKSMMMGVYHELTPFKEQKLPDVDVDDCDHLLDFLYHMTAPNDKELHPEAIEIPNEDQITKESADDHEESSAKPRDLRRFLDPIWKILPKLNANSLDYFKKIIFGKPATKNYQRWNILSNLAILKLFKEPMKAVLKQFVEVPLIEEIKIPSVTEMAKAGILFAPAVNGGILDIRFHTKTSTLYLPVVYLDVNTEVYFRNLVAYEACVAAGPLVVARYTELMNGIIDTEEDAEFLREKNIVFNHLKSNKEVADMWNGMSKSVKLTKVPKLDTVIKEVNDMYEKKWRVKFSRFMKKYVFASWKILTLLAALFLLLLSTVQAVCSVYSCARVIYKLPEVPEGTVQ